MDGERAEVEVPLAEMIETLRQELTAAIKAGADKDLHFELGEIELELQVAVSRRTGLQGGIKISVLSFGADRGKEHASTHTLRLKLQPAGEVLISKPTEDEPE
jgi:Trypsin-co-occurring domain 2